jgi:hypothetical protein
MILSSYGKYLQATINELRTFCMMSHIRMTLFNPKINSKCLQDESLFYISNSPDRQQASRKGFLRKLASA